MTTTTAAIRAPTRLDAPRRAGALAAALALALTLSACDQQQRQQDAAAQSAAQAQGQEAAKNLAVYNDLREKESWDLAASIGEDLVKRFPGSPQAAAVNQTLADTQEKAKGTREQKRLGQLWTYQSGEESGGQQNTASIYSDEPGPEDQRVRLVLRRHSSWGQSAYLVSPGTGFECGKEAKDVKEVKDRKGSKASKASKQRTDGNDAAECTISVALDDQPAEKVKATLPDTSDPAILIEDDQAFIDKLGQAKKISIELKQKGKEPQTVVFEVGGFDPAKFPEVAKG
jgi:hypothetical protein